MKKMTIEKFNEFKTFVETCVKNRPSDWTEGKAVYNYAYRYLDSEDYHPAALSSDSVDCYYNDAVIPDFWKMLEEELIK